MWELRLILILLGVVFIAAVYFFSRQKKSRSRDFRRDAPSLGDAQLTRASFDAGPAPLISRTPAREITDEPGMAGAESGGGRNSRQLILALHVAAHGHASFAGEGVLAALQFAGLRYGRYQAFHRLVKDDADQSVFSVANMVEPGVLDPGALPQMQIPGLTLFLLLPGPQDGVAACADMLATARLLARRLGGEVLDESHSTLTPQTAQRIRERIIEFQRQIQSPQAD